MNVEEFVPTVYRAYDTRGRADLPWRQPDANGAFDPYKIMVSELMLQQTQVPRVIPKYHAFLEQFPTYQALADAELSAVLRAWQGLGYNRRAKFLWQAAKLLTEQNEFPKSIDGLVQLPGVGKNTAGAIMAYAYNAPVVFVETNIRTVYFEHFFQGRDAISDAEVAARVEETLDRENPRDFYWALMDYGSWLKSQVRNNSQSKHYAKQSKFQGSRREIRGKIIRMLSENSRTEEVLIDAIDDERLRGVLDDLLHEGMIVRDKKAYRLA